MSHVIEFQPSGKKIEVDDKTTVIRAARKAGLHINASCGGTGVCGKCHILLESGAVSGGISEKFSQEEIAGGTRQACTAQITEDVVVRILDAAGLKKGQLGTAVPERHRTGKYVFNLDELRQAGLFIPPVEKFFLELPSYPDRPQRSAHTAKNDQGKGFPFNGHPGPPRP